MSNEDLIKELAKLIDTGTAPESETQFDNVDISRNVMSSENFIKKLAELMDTDAALTLATKLADVEDWDSLSMASFFSFCNTTLSRKVLPEQIKAAQTVEDFFRLATD